MKEKMHMQIEFRGEKVTISLLNEQNNGKILMDGQVYAWADQKEKYEEYTSLLKAMVDAYNEKMEKENEK